MGATQLRPAVTTPVDHRQHRVRLGGRGRLGRLCAPVGQASPARAGPTVADPLLLGRAVLPFDTFGGGPPAGALVTPNPNNGVTFPLPEQPVEGFSSIVDGRRTRGVPGHGGQRLRWEGGLGGLPDPGLLHPAALQDGSGRGGNASTSATSSPSATRATDCRSPS